MHNFYHTKIFSNNKSKGMISGEYVFEQKRNDIVDEKHIYIAICSQNICNVRTMK